MYLKAINATLAAWVVGLFADANIRLGDPQGFLCLRGLLLRQYMHNTEIAVTMRLSTILKTIKQPL